MIGQINKLKLPKGEWQKAIKEALGPYAEKVVCNYPDKRTLKVTVYSAELLDEKGFLKPAIVSFSLSFMYGNYGVLISHKMFVSPAFRGKGNAKKLQPIKKRIAKDLGVSALIATVVSTNEAEKKVICDWDKIVSFYNGKTGNEIDVYFTKL